MIIPPALCPGDRIGVFAGSSPFDPTLALRGLGWLAQRYEVVFDRGMFSRSSYLAGDDHRRRCELAELLSDPSIKALVAVRGGYGLSRFAHDIDWSFLPESPRWLVGFSDVTVLHAEAANAGVASIHGPMVATLGRADAWTRQRFIDTLEAPLSAHTLAGLCCLHVGAAEGQLFGGNLTLLHACAAAGRLHVPDGAVLLLEDVTERPYRVDRMLTTLELGGHFSRVSAIVLGEWTDCHPGPDRARIEDVLYERLSRLGVPLVSGASIGHGRWNDPVVLGRRWRVDASAGVASAV